ncbi:hypothetical protein SAMN02745751_00090 [Dethiosulfatibacter aminovorans DSM 17477]|uniref:Uncharacterized protein n=1 Tax=Dethiosulfatibacter aminovorans DSM 17477 TaxID=1121476 RepID=A0A1M6AEH3_9FIRM|nr:hypothetical protein [Dethiosulfatibacter aminovorans]SHI34791.1 hypothetical protein SAMN02745751_00090 [Dethiosulfatibacter aminovorans DSM 17477]
MFRRISKILLKMTDKEGMSAEKLFNHEFMREHTSFISFEQMIKSSGITMKEIKSISNLESLGSDVFNDFIKNGTKFESWQEMLEKARETMLHKV